MKSFNLSSTFVSLSLLALLVSGKPLDKSESSQEALDPVSSSDSGRGSKGSRSARYLGSSWFDYLPGGGLQEQILPRGATDDQNDNQADSPIYYIRLPPNPYVYMPGMGYVSRPSPPPVQAPPPPSVIHRPSPFIQLPLPFVSNGKPGSTVQIWPNEPVTPAPTLAPVRKPSYKPPTTINKLPGPYFFNGKPSGFYILQQDPYNSLYADVLHNFYP